MKRVKIARAEWECQELMQEWGLKNDRDIKRLIMSGDLRPFAWFDAPLLPIAFGENGAAVPLGDPKSPGCNLWAVQRLAKKAHNFDFVYQVLCDEPEELEGASYWALANPMATQELLAFFVFSGEDVSRYEEAQRKASQREPNAREEKTRDKLIAGLACEHLGWKPWEPGADLELTKFLDALGAFNIPVSRNAAKEHIRRAWERAKPEIA